MERLLTPKELGELLQVKLSTIYKWAHLEFVPHIKVGKCVRFRESDIEVWLKKRAEIGRLTQKVAV
jgi:excisionase family DNA binding protein